MLSPKYLPTVLTKNEINITLSIRQITRNLFLYIILPELSDYVKPLGDLQSFENEWMEVEVLGPRSPLQTTETSSRAIDISGTSPVTDDSGMPAFLCDNIDPNYMQLGSDDSELSH